VLRARNQLLERGEHLAAVADAEREGILTREETRELLAHGRVEQDGFRPAFTRAEHVTVGEAATGDQPLELGERAPARQQIGHVHIVRLEAGAMQDRGGLDLAVHALLSQHRNRGPRAARDVRRRDVGLRIERERD
jgi:hypothetical protein